MRFKKSEIEELEKLGFEVLDNVMAVYEGFSYSINIEKQATDSFDVHYEVDADEDDLDYDLIRANGNESEYDISWEELLNFIGEYR